MGYTPHVLVVGGDPVGAAIARDLAIRGVEVTLVEAGSIAASRTSRMGWVLSSGAQVAGTDPALARRYLAENRTLFEIANHTVTDTGGLVVDTAGENGESDDGDFDRLRAVCEESGIVYTEFSADEARSQEPGLGDAVTRALRVPDAVIDPYQVTHATVRDAREYGATVRPRTGVTDITVENGAIQSVTLEHDPVPSVTDPAMAEGSRVKRDGETDTTTQSVRPSDGNENETGDEGEGETDVAEADEPPVQVPESAAKRAINTAKRAPGTVRNRIGRYPNRTVEELDVDYVVNAAGPRAGNLLDLAGLSLPVEPEPEVTVVTAQSPVETVVSRPGGSDFQSVAPFATSSVVSSSRADIREEFDSPPVSAHRERTVQSVSPALADTVCESVGEVVPKTTTTHLLRADHRVGYSVGELADDGEDFLLVDHEARDGCWGLLTVLGGTVTSHRFAAERAVDAVCAEFGIRRACQTDDLVLPGSESVPDLAQAVGTFGLDPTDYERSKARLGSRASTVLYSNTANPVLCPDRSVSRAEVRDALNDGATSSVDLDGVRTRTAATTGICQGGQCGHRLAAELHPEYDAAVAETSLDALLVGRWRGQRSVAYGRRLQEMARTHRTHVMTMDRERESDDIEVTAYDGGPPRPPTEQDRCCRAVTTVGAPIDGPDMTGEPASDPEDREAGSDFWSGWHR